MPAGDIMKMNLKNKLKTLIMGGILMTVTSTFLTGCGQEQSQVSYATPYGVYLSEEYSDLPDDLSCEVLVIDAQYYSKEQISALKRVNGEVYSYLNLGSIEDFRPYFQEYEDITLGEYENWPGEYWVQTMDPSWQSLVLDELAPEMVEKGIDGFFIDNADVYYVYPSEDIYNGLCTMLETLKSRGSKIIINGGDSFVTKYLDENGNLDALLDGVSQESVFTQIDWDTATFTESDEDSREFFMDYLSRVKEAGKEAYVIEYSEDDWLTEQARKGCQEAGYILYVSDGLEL